MQVQRYPEKDFKYKEWEDFLKNEPEQAKATEALILESAIGSESEEKKLRKLAKEKNALFVKADLKPGQEVEFHGLKCVIARLQPKEKIITLRML